MCAGISLDLLFLLQDVAGIQMKFLRLSKVSKVIRRSQILALSMLCSQGLLILAALLLVFKTFCILSL